MTIFLIPALIEKALDLLNKNAEVLKKESEEDNLIDIIGEINMAEALEKNTSSFKV